VDVGAGLRMVAVEGGGPRSAGGWAMGVGRGDTKRLAEEEAATLRAPVAMSRCQW
jgi:hypothetical protein